MQGIQGFELAGAELPWPIGSAAGMTNHPDIEAVAARFAGLTEAGLGFVVLGSWKLGEASGGNGYIKNDTGWEHVGGDEYVDIETGAGFNAKGLPGPGTDTGIDRLPDLIDLGHSQGVEVALSLSPHTSEPLEELREILEVGRKALAAGVLYVEVNLSCPNVPGRPPFYQDIDAVGQFYEMVRSGAPLPNRHGQPGIYPKYGPGLTLAQMRATMQMTIGSQSIGGRVTSNTLGNQQPMLPDGVTPAIQVNNGKAGESGPALTWLGREELLHARETQQIMPGASTEQLVSVLGVTTGREVKRRLDLGASAVQLGSVLYWPELISCETQAETVEQIKVGFVHAMEA